LTLLYIVAVIQPPLEILFVIVNGRTFLVGAGLTTVLLLPFELSSQAPTTTSGRGTSASASYDTSAFAALRWREIGPFRGGRSVAVAGSSKRPHEYFFGTTGGGVFKTTDGGITWAPVTEFDFLMRIYDRTSRPMTP
jgi:hypothetical protein